MPTSQLGTYVRGGELLVFPFFEYVYDRNREYQPVEFGFGSNHDRRGRYQGFAGQLFVAYGLTNWLAFEIQAAYVSASLERGRRDTSGMPAELRSNGLTDLEAQLRVRALREGAWWPEVFVFLEGTAPSQKGHPLIGDAYWDLKPGIGITKGFSWGTLTFRSDLEYNREAKIIDIGETALEYLKVLSPAWRIHAAFEGGEGGAPDEFELVFGVEWRVTDFVYLKLDNGIGVMSKSTDWSPQIGCMIAVPVQQGD